MTPTRSKRKTNEEALLEAREKAALEQLEATGFRVTLHKMREWHKADPLLGVEEGWDSGECYVVAYSTDGRRRSFSGISACAVLADVQGWLRYQRNALPESRFVISKDLVAVPVRQQVAGDKAETELRRANTERRIVSFDGGTAHLVDAHGNSPKGDNDARASAHA